MNLYCGKLIAGWSDALFSFLGMSMEGVGHLTRVLV